jgi:hypothetical protein
MAMANETIPFNSPLETGVRSLVILSALFPKSADLNRLINLDYLVVHSGDAGGPESLHAPLPLRSGELLVRRDLIEKGLLLMMSRNLIDRLVSGIGIEYQASETAIPFVQALSCAYNQRLKHCAVWLADTFGSASDHELHEITGRFFKQWTTQFQPIESKSGNE